MNDEHLRKKLGLYYHPLFQAIVQEWASVFLNGQNAMDIITFIEINLRAQKAILPEVDFGNSLSSALNDWIREISSLSQEDVLPQKTPAKIENNEDTLKAIQKILENFPFELTLSIEDYISFFQEQLDLIKMSYVVDKMSTEGFGKFLFDLCYSWCEHLDIELFSFFLLSVFYQTIRFESQGYLEARSFEEVYYFPESLLVQLKLLKTHYSRYKKVDLTSYDSWYEWNYLPHRINEIKQKLMEVFANIFREDENVAGYLEGLYWSSIQDITQKGLDKPSTAHFAIFSKENIEPQYTNTRDALIESIINGEHPIHIQNNLQQKNMQSPKIFNQTKKKPIVPLVENISVQNGQEEEGQVRTLKSIVPFLGDIEPAMQGDPLQKQTQLYPIWEHEVSDTTSIATRCSVERDTPLKINKKIRDLSREKARHIISAKREDKNYRGHTPIKANDSNSSGHFAQNLSASGKIKTTISPRMLEQLSIPQLLTPAWSPKVFSETPNEHKTNNILCETNSTKNGRLSAPLVKNTVKMMLASSSGAMNIRNAIFEEVGSNNNVKRGMADKKLMKLFGPPGENMQRSATAVRSRQKGRTYKEVSSELTKLLKDDRYDFTIVGKSTAQEEELLLSSRGKYGLDLQAIDVEDRDRIEQRENLKLEQVTWTKSPKLNLTYRAQSTRVNRSPYREYTSPEAKGKTSRGMNKRPAIGAYLQVSNEAKKDNNYSHIKLLFPQTTVSRTTQIKVATSRPELDQQAIGKNLKDLFGKMKEKQENTRKKQDIRIKRIKKTDSKQNTQVTSQLIEVKKI